MVIAFILIVNFKKSIKNVVSNEKILLKDKSNK